MCFCFRDVYETNYTPPPNAPTKESILEFNRSIQQNNGVTLNESGSGLRIFLQMQNAYKVHPRNNNFTPENSEILYSQDHTSVTIDTIISSMKDCRTESFIGT